MATTTLVRQKPLALSRKRAYAAAIAGAWGGVLVVACASHPPPSAALEATASPVEPATASGVNATVIVSKCPDASRINVRTAQDTINKLVGPCASVPGGRAHFSATLQPGGRIELASPEGDPAEGVVPTCVLKNRLVHKVPLKSPCALDVQLDERTVVIAPPEAGAPDANPGTPVP
jgi:hypothetical protein